MQTLMDFLSGREFRVEINNTRSQTRHLKVGCVQGSILGPKLFTLYIRGLENLFKETHLVTFADDSYVSVSGNSIEEVRDKIKENLTRHDDFLTSIGMVTNVEKTELIYFARTPITDLSPIKIGPKQVIPGKKLKVLGIYFEENLQWKNHVNTLMSKSKHIIAKMRFISKYVDLQAMKKILTSHFFGSMYYGCAVWLNELTTAMEWRKLETLHYKAIRVACKDYRRKKSRNELDTIFNRARPRQWMQYITTKTAIQVTTMKAKKPPLAQKIIDNMYYNDRTNKTVIMDTSRTRAGRQAFQNRLNCMRDVNFDWRNGVEKNKLRVELKKIFFV